MSNSAVCCRYLAFFRFAYVCLILKSMQNLGRECFATFLNNLNFIYLNANDMTGKNKPDEIALTCLLEN